MTSTAIEKLISYYIIKVDAEIVNGFLKRFYTMLIFLNQV
ncbi:hypothetical protein HMPREF9103_02224 [Lentilactobacillus parafarraginis F0439]|uniref:Uncharacterized protein n=1 Tax=Lentilactobacillus parafarraginis F0439 TaxID=797515 RepID=G9ZR63_9LACO|nr:hypothetical protein HMPREF9103_02224 [Lentilactobacillus parafarraginis F0439]